MTDDGATHITDEDIEAAIEFLRQAFECQGDQARKEALGRAVRTVTRMWALANPHFDGGAWYPVSYLLTEHWTEIRAHTDQAAT